MAAKRLAAVSALPWPVMRGRSRCRRRRFDAHTSIGRDRARPRRDPAGGAGRRGAAARRGQCARVAGIEAQACAGDVPGVGLTRPAAPPSAPAGCSTGGPRCGSAARRRPTGGRFPAREPAQAAVDAPPAPDPALIGAHARLQAPRKRSRQPDPPPDQPRTALMVPSPRLAASSTARSAPLSGPPQRSRGPSWRPEPPAARPAGPPAARSVHLPAPPIRPGTPGTRPRPPRSVPARPLRARTHRRAYALRVSDFGFWIGFWN